MSSVEKTIRLYAWQPNYLTFKVVQGESRSRYFQIQLIDSTYPIDLTNSSVQFYAIKPDSTIIYTNCTIINAASGQVQVAVPEQAAAVPGVVDCWIQVTGTDGSDLRFDGAKLEVMECSLESGVLSEDENKVFEQALARLSSIEYEIQEARGTFDSLGAREDDQDSRNPEQPDYAPSVHAHGNITSDGKIGTKSNMVVITGDNGVLITISKENLQSFLNLHRVAISGSYNDLSDKPTMPTVPNITASQTDLTAGTSELPTGDIYLVYE